MRYKVVLMSGVWQSDWFDSEDGAWEYIDNITHNGEPCEMCQAEYEVFSEEELKDIEEETND